MAATSGAERNAPRASNSLRSSLCEARVSRAPSLPTSRPAVRAALRAPGRLQARTPHLWHVRAAPDTSGHTEAPVVSTSDWVQDLSALFDWGLPGNSRASNPPTVVLDGANISWAYGQALAKRFRCKAYPCSQGLLLAIHHEPWKINGVAVKAVMPMSYVQGPLEGLADGCGGLRALVDPEKVTRRSDDLWRNEPLWKEYEAGRLQLVKRPPTEIGRAEDDLTVLRVSRDMGGFVCSNDLYRQHYRVRTGGQKQKDGNQLFQNKRRFAQWSSLRHFGLRFNVAPGLNDAMLTALWRSVGLLPEEIECAPEAGAPQPGPPPGWDQIKFWTLPKETLPVFFGPEPNMQMMTAWESSREALERHHSA